VSYNHGVYPVLHLWPVSKLRRVVTWKPTDVSPASSQLNGHPSKKLACSKHSFVRCFLHTSFLFWLIFNPQDGGGIFLRNVG
jgi:hypothetical protein